MSCCVVDEQAVKRSREIDETLKQDRKKQTLKLLLLGTGDSGKSTFAKQMTIIHKDGFSHEELVSSVMPLRANTLDSMKVLLTACNDWKISFSEQLDDVCREVLSASQLTESVAKLIQILWKSTPVRTAFQMSNRMQLPGGASTTAYYFENVQRFAEPDFVPTYEDILRVKLKTTGILETSFEVLGTGFVMVDVGGQRSERTKWLSCFNDVSAVIYLAALNEYDMLMEEDDKTNRMEESIRLFQKLSGSHWLKDTPMILFLNKCDLFEDKIKDKPLRDFFQDYDDHLHNFPNATPLEAGLEFFKEQFTTVFNGSSRLYVYVTCALDRLNCEKVFYAVRDALMARVFTDNF